MKNFCMDGLVIDKNGRKRASATRSQNLFWQISRIAEMLGMKVNNDKTKLLCVSESRTYEAAAFIEDVNGKVIESESNMKILGLHFSGRPDMAAQVDAICRKFRARIWTLRHLHPRGFSQEDLLRVYKSTILPCQDYCWNVFHSSLTLSQTVVPVRLQAKALKAIYGFDPSYRELMERANITMLRARREARELAFARKCSQSARYQHWFLLREVERTGRERMVYEERFARTSRCYNSPLFSMRRCLNRAEEGAREGRTGEGERTTRT